MYFININKPKNITSFDVIRVLRKKLNLRQIGHSGTLDPLASGVLQIAVGRATKLLDYLDSDKIYVAKMNFGYITESFDSETPKQFVKKPDFSISDLRQVLDSFVGKIDQTPPKYSALKMYGRKICDIIRDNVDVDINFKTREIEIYSIELLDFKNDTATIKVHCKRGTYIRSLINDVGSKLLCGAYMSDLKRVQVGNFKIENSDELESTNYHKINPVDALTIQSYELNDIEYNRISHGNFIKLNNAYKNGTIMLTKNNKLVSIANLSDNLIKPKRFFREV